MRKTWQRYLSGIFIALLLSGCATVPKTTAPSPSQLTWHQREAQLNSIKNWTLKGAVSVRQPNKASIVSLTWQQQGQQYQQTLAGPFDIGAIKIIGRPGHVALWKSSQEKLVASNPESLLQQAVGWRLPVQNLYYWVRGLPAPNSPAKKQLDASNRLLTLRQNGWQINYNSYQTVNGVDLPNTIVLSTTNLTVKMVIRQWLI